MIGVIADDITGANDIGIMFAKGNWVTKVYTNWEHTSPTELADGADVLVLDTDSRYESCAEAAARVRQAALVLRSLGCNFFYKKTCSGLRGNIGCELDALLETVDEPFCLVVAAYPKNGRTTLHGKHYVNNVLLEASSLANDPVNPMKVSDVVSIVAASTAQRITRLSLDTVRKCSAELMAAVVAAQKAGYRYVVCDAETQNDMEKLAAIVAGQKVFCGSAALAEELVAYWQPKQQQNLLVHECFCKGLGGLVVAGSLTPETRRQIQSASDAGIPVFAVDTLALISPYEAAHEIRRVANMAIDFIKAGRDVVIYTTNSPDNVSATRAQGQHMGIGTVEVSRRISQQLAQLAAQIVHTTGTQRIVLAGGDTSAAVCRELGIVGNWVLHEIQPGIPSGLSIGKHRCLLVLKSGSFGNAGFFTTALSHLKDLTYERT